MENVSDRVVDRGWCVSVADIDPSAAERELFFEAEGENFSLAVSVALTSSDTVDESSRTLTAGLAEMLRLAVDVKENEPASAGTDTRAPTKSSQSHPCGVTIPRILK
jgi:hypothetical protein